ncbi:MAG: glycosyltransferase family 4 protein [Gemmatimonadota bacterium]
MRPLRLGYLCADPGIPPDGTKGASVHFREFGRALVRNGVELQAVTRRGPGGPWGEFPLRVAQIGERAADSLVRELDDLTDQQPVVEALDASGPIDAIYERYTLFGLAGLRHARSRGVPHFLEVNAPLWEEARTYRSLSLSGTAHAIARELFRRASRVLVVSEGLRDRVIAEGADPDRVVVFPNGVAPSFLNDGAPAPRPEVLQGRPVLTFVGSLKPWHGIEMLLDAFVAMPERLGLGLWVIGDGPEAARVDRLAARHPDRVVRTPAVAHEDVPAVLRASDITVAPYTAASPSYFCPLKVIEAFAVGVPLLASAVPAVERLDLEGIHLDTFQPGSLSSFRAALEAVLADLPAAQGRAHANREVARRRYTWDQRALELKAMLKQSVRAPRRAGAA